MTNMNLKNIILTAIRSIKAHPIWFSVGAVVFLGILIAAWPRRQTQASTAKYTVRRSDFLISIVEGGNLQAVNEISIRNEVEGVDRIIFIVPEGSYVKKGDLLVELDSSNARDQVNLQTINFEKSQFALVQAQEQYQIQKSVVESDVRSAELKLEFAKTDLKKYLEGEARQERRKAEIDIANIEEKLAIDNDRLKWSEKLHQQGFETKSNLDSDRLKVSQSKLSLETATNNLWMIETFDYSKKRRLYESNVEEAASDLERIKHQGQRKLAQYEADVRTQEITLELSKTKLERDKKNLDAAKIIAPQDGLVVYPVSDSHFSSESLIEEGATVRNRQVLIKLPDVSEMKVTVKIHESHINMVQLGQPAFVVLDSMPDRRFNGFVNKVGLLPDSQSRYGNPNLKVYATEVVVKDDLPDIKPGVSARAEIVITNLQNVITVPIQTVATKQGRPVVYLADEEPPKPVPIAVGMYNTKFIEVITGLKEGDQILLAPPFDTQDKDLGGAILGEGDKNTVTNLLAEPRPKINGQDESNGDARANGDRKKSGGVTKGGMPEELRKQFDKNGDGQLDEAERAAMRERFAKDGATPGRTKSREPGETQNREDAPRSGGKRPPGNESGPNGPRNP
jgi:HlyD family secretion protein